jgi:uncharacterized protein (TIGR02001 family)
MLAAAAVLMCLAAPAAAQDASPNGGAITLSGALDFTNAYMFRGIKQESDGLIMQPYLDLGVSLYKGEGSVKSFGLNIGTWNSLHGFNLTGTDNLRNHKLWYESDFYAGMSFGMTGGVTTAVTFTAYTSPNDSFETVNEIAFKVSLDDAKYAYAKTFALHPYGVFASEFNIHTGRNGLLNEQGVPVTGGQADAGNAAGNYVELGVGPTFKIPMATTLTVPVKIGLSLTDYYEKPGGGNDSHFGYASVAGVLTHQLNKKPSKVGNWNVHVGVEYQRLGDTTKLFLNEFKDNGEMKSYKVIYSGGLGFSY